MAMIAKRLEEEAQQIGQDAQSTTPVKDGPAAVPVEHAKLASPVQAQDAQSAAPLVECDTQWTAGVATAHEIKLTDPTVTTDATPNVTQLALGALDFARSRKFTAHGEMFCASQLRVVGADHFGLCVSQSALTVFSLVNALLSDGFAVVAYDAAPSHRPSLARGHKSHWTVVCGLVVALSEADGALLCSALDPSSAAEAAEERRDRTGQSPAADDSLWFLDVSAATSRAGSKTKSESETHTSLRLQLCVNGRQLSLLDVVPPSDVYVIVQHGKSKHQDVWPIEELIQSSAQLYEIASSRVDQGMCLPDNLDDLRSQLLVVTV